MEDDIGGQLYENEHRMPSFPVLSIRETLERFLPTAFPLAETEEEQSALEISTASSTFA